MKLGVTLPSFQRAPEQAIVVARAAEAAGLDGVFCYDHLFRVGADGRHRPALDVTALLGAVAAATTRIWIGTLVARASLRPPATLEVGLETVARLAPGRLIVGVGSGDSESQQEQRAFGLRGTTVRDRVEALQGAVAALRGHNFPVWVGGTSSAVRRVAARADGWNRWGSTPARFARELASLDVAGRPDFTPSWGGLVAVDEDLDPAAVRAGRRPDTIAGGPDEVAARLRAYVSAGARWLVLGPLDASDEGQARRLGEEVAPRLRAALGSS